MIGVGIENNDNKKNASKLHTRGARRERYDLGTGTI